MKLDKLGRASDGKQLLCTLGTLKLAVKGDSKLDLITFLMFLVEVLNVKEGHVITYHDAVLLLPSYTHTILGWYLNDGAYHVTQPLPSQGVVPMHISAMRTTVCPHMY